MILAVGQRVDASALEAAGLPLTGGRLAADPLTQRTAVEGVFAGGDVATGPATVIPAMAAGRRAAEAIDAELRLPAEAAGPLVVRPRPDKAPAAVAGVLDRPSTRPASRAHHAPRRLLTAPRRRADALRRGLLHARRGLDRGRSDSLRQLRLRGGQPSDLAPVLIALRRNGENHPPAPAG